MKKTLAIIASILMLTPYSAMAAFNTNSATLVAASSQSFSRADEALVSPTGDFTLEGWFKFTTLPSSADYFLITKYGGLAATRAFIFYLHDVAGTKTLQMVIQGSSSDSSVSVSWTPSTATWYHLAVTFEASSGDVKFYVDGSQQGTTQSSGLSDVRDGTAAFKIGHYDGAGNFFDGETALVRLWKGEARTVTEIADNDCTHLGSTTNLSGEWTLDNTLNDNSGNSLTLTNNGSATFTTDVPSVCAAAPAGAAAPITFFRFFWWW